MSIDRQCDVCGDVGKVTVACSACGAMSFAYCARCGSNGYEPYRALVASAYGCDCLEEFEEWYQEVITKSLKFHGVSVQDFMKDVAAATKEYCENL